MDKELLQKMYMKKYYVYTHSLDGVVFYVGKGTGARCLEFYARSECWNKHLDLKGKRLHDIDVDIVKTFDYNQEALDFERELIVKINSQLVNVVHSNFPSKLVNNQLINKLKLKKYTFKNNKLIVDQGEKIKNYDELKVKKEEKLGFKELEKTIPQKANEISNEKNNFSQKQLEILSENLNKLLDAKDKEELCRKLFIITSRSKIAKWNITKRILIENGYFVEDYKLSFSKQIRFSVIFSDPSYKEKVNLKPIN